jgi:hypothetical protein
MADLRITDLPLLVEADVAANDVLPIADVSASETKKVTVKDLTEAGVALIDNGSIPSAKLASLSPALLGNSSAAAQFIAGPTATTGAFAARVIAAGDLPIATAAARGAVSIGAGLAVTGGGALSLAAATSATLGGVSIPTASGLSVDGSGVLSHISSIAAQTKNGITVNTTGHVTAIGAIASADLPLATATDVGGIFVGSGLAVTVGGQLNHAATVTPGTISGITYNGSGHITATTALVGTDLPVATASTRGAVSVPAGALDVDGAGALTHVNSTVTPGEYAKVTVDARGHVTAGNVLNAGDIPDLAASKITSGTFNVSLLGTSSITGAKLADSSTVQFGGAGSTAGVVTFPTAEFKGQYFWDELNGDLYIWSGSAWLPVTITSGELVFAGTYDASTNLIGSVTAPGSAIGLTIGAALPAASDVNNRYYLVVSDSGTGTGNAPPELLAPPDMLLSNGTTWELIDVSNAIAGQTATNISFTPYGNIAATNVQLALQELDDEKLGSTGGTVNGELLIGSTGALAFEGSTADAYETYLAVVDPTADRTITFPDVSGTVVTTGDTGSVTSAMIANGTIVDADVNASAAIAGTKIQQGSTTVRGTVQLTDSTSSTSTTTAATPAAVKTAFDLANAALPKAGGVMTGDITLNAQSDLRWADADSSHWVAFQAPATVVADVTWTLPAADGSSGQVLSTNGTGTLSWATAASGDVTLTGTQTLTNKTLTDPAIIGTILEDVFTITDGAAFEVDPGNGSVQLITLGANRTPKATNFAAGEAVTLMVDDGSAYTLTWSDATWGGTGVVWKTNAGAAPTLNTTGYTVITFWKVGTQVYGARVGDA